MKKNIFKIICLFIIGMVGGIFADQILGPYYFYQGPVIQRVTKVEEIYIEENTVLLVRLDAINGKFMESSYFRVPQIYPKVDSENAKEILIESINDDKIINEITKSIPTQVWKPCEQTRSPYYPLWEIKINNNTWYIDQNGKIHEKINDFSMKGGAYQVTP